MAYLCHQWRWLTAKVQWASRSHFVPSRRSTSKQAAHFCRNGSQIPTWWSVFAPWWKVHLSLLSCHKAKFIWHAISPLFWKYLLPTHSVFMFIGKMEVQWPGFSPDPGLLAHHTHAVLTGPASTRVSNELLLTLYPTQWSGSVRQWRGPEAKTSFCMQTRPESEGTLALDLPLLE